MAAQAIKLAPIQMSVGLNKAENVKRACSFVKKAATQGANLIALPGFFNSPYGTNYFPEYAEEIPGPSATSLADSAKDNNMYLVGGSIPEKDGVGNLYNTCTVFDPAGQMVAKYHKMHLYDIDIPGKIRFLESDVLKPGNEFVTFEAFGIKIGLAICYGLRFAEIAQIYAQLGCQLIVYPGGFNTATGQTHMELLQRSRALDNQVYVAAICPARDEKAEYVMLGHSKLVDPWAKVVAEAGTGKEVVYGDVNVARLEEVRSHIPLSKQKRFDLYTPPTINYD